MTQTVIAMIGIDLGKNTFHLIGLDARAAIGSLSAIEKPVGAPAR